MSRQQGPLGLRDRIQTAIIYITGKIYCIKNNESQSIVEHSIDLRVYGRRIVRSDHDGLHEQGGAGRFRAAPGAGNRHRGGDGGRSRLSRCHRQDRGS